MPVHLSPNRTSVNGPAVALSSTPSGRHTSAIRRSADRNDGVTSSPACRIFEKLGNVTFAAGSAIAQYGTSDSRNAIVYRPS